MVDMKEYEQETSSAILRNDNPKNIILNFADMSIMKFINSHFISQDVNAGFIPTSSLIAFKTLIYAKYSILYADLFYDKKFNDLYVRIEFLKEKLKTNKLESDEDEQEYQDDCFEILNKLSLVQAQKYMPTRRDVRINIRGDPVKTKVDDRIW